MELQAKGIIKTGADRNTTTPYTQTLQDPLPAIHHECNVELDDNFESMNR